MASLLITLFVIMMIGRANLDGYREGYQRGYKLAEDLYEQQLQRRDEYLRRREKETRTEAS